MPRQVALIESVHRWYCPNCGKEDTTQEKRPHTRMHTCPRLGFLTAPMLPAGTQAKVFAVEREDYLGADAGKVRLDSNGRPVMSIVTVRDNGQDAVVFAPLAAGTGRS